MSSARAVSVAFTKRREIADLDRPLERSSRSSSDRLGDLSVAPGRHPGQHALDHERVQQVSS